MGAGEYRLVWSLEAETDLISIWRWGAREWSQEQADRHLCDIENACERLLDNPLFGSARDELIAGVRSLVVHPHVVFYRARKHRVEVVRVLHQHREYERCGAQYILTGPRTTLPIFHTLRRCGATMSTIRTDDQAR